MHNILPKKDNKGIGGAIVGGVGQVVDAYDLNPANQNTTTNSIAGNSPSVSAGSTLDPKSANTSSAFRPKGRVTPSVRGGHGVKKPSRPSN